MLYLIALISNILSLILESLAHEDWIMRDKPIQVLLKEFTESGVKFKVRCWIENFLETWISEDRLNTVIYKFMITADIEMPSSTVIIYFTDRETYLTIS